MPVTIDDLKIVEDAEIQRLLALTLSPEELTTIDTYYRAKWTTSSREAHKSSGGYFAGPGTSFPLKDCSDAKDAWGLAGHADNPGKVRSNIKSWASKHGCSLPESAKEDGKREEIPLIIRADGTHDAFTGKHAHPHAANNSQGGDANHDHSHSHDGDSDHGHAHADVKKSDTPDITRSLPSETSIYMPILRIDRAKREVILRATAEALDSYGTVIGFDGSKEAFAKWRGNIREMHDPTKAVGRAIKWEPIPEDKAIDLTLRVSRGAEDTWLKCLDGTLTGGSIGARNGKWGKRTIDGKEVPFLERYDLVEVSLVDNPSCPNCDVKVVRADGLINQDVLDDEPEEEEPRPAVEETRADVPDTTRAGARISHVTQDALHSMRDGHLLNAKSTMQLCGCDECMTGSSAMDPDGDGDIDLMPTSMLDIDSDGGASGDGSGDGQSRADIAEIIREEIGRQMSPTITRMNGIAARLATTDTPPQTITTTIATPDSQLIQRLDGLEHKIASVASSTEIAEVRSLLSEVKEQLVSTRSLTEQIAAQPQAGGPIVNSAALQNQPQYMQSDPLQEDAATVARLAKAGILNKNQQIDAVLYLQRAQQQASNGRR